jgi:hypothetical protein
MKLVLIFACGAVLGSLAGAAAMLVAFPFLFPPPPAADPLPLAAGQAVVQSAPKAAASLATPATFVFDETAPGRDSIHWANGTGRILDTGGGLVLRLDETFVAGPGPAFWVYLNTQAVGDRADFNADAGRIKLAPLRSFSGAQNYALPEGLDLDTVHTVTIWCERFGVYIGSAELVRADG